MLGFVGVILLVICLVHLYLWKRLVWDPFRRGWTRRTLSVLAVGLAVLVPVTLIGTRSGHVRWLAWPGYVWIGLMFYLLIALVLLEVPRAGLLWVVRRRTRTAEKAEETAGATAAAARDAIGPPGASSGGVSAAVAANAAAGPPAIAGNPAAGARAVTDNPAAGPPAATHNPAAGPPAAADNPAGGHAADGVDGGGNRVQAAGVRRRLVLARGVAIAGGIAAAGVTGYGMVTALGPPQLQRVRLPIAKLPRRMDGFRVAVVSDIHLGPMAGTHHVGRLVDMINSVTPDIVCVVGDLVDGTVAELGRYAEPLTGIRSRHGAFFVTGNHEYYSGFQPWVAEVAELGVRPLRNDRVEIDGLDLAGVNDLSGGQYGDAPDFARALGDRDRSRPVVLMAHQPAAARQAAPFGVDLQVSGHTHGGQLAPFGLVVRLQQPIVSGFGTVDGVPVFVTNGTGFWGPPVRVGAPPQVTVLDLRSP